MMPSAWYDLSRLFALRDSLQSLDSAAPPAARLLSAPLSPPPRRLGVLCGSFNPLTLAHAELAQHASLAFQLDQLLYTVAKVTVDKEKVTGMGLEDRVLLLLLHTQQHPHQGVALVNRGLYFEQAQAFQALFDKQVELFFIVGMDKLVQILDARYYQDREAALAQLFALTSLVVANRGDMEQQAFDALLHRSANQPYRDAIHFLPLPESVAGLSSTAIRNTSPEASKLQARVPSEVALFLAEARPYAAPRQCGHTECGQRYEIDAYAVRLALFERLAAVRDWAEPSVDFHQLLTQALAPDPSGQALRGAPSGEALQALIKRSTPWKARHCMNQNLEVLIEDHAKIMADQMVKAVEWAGSEEDIRHECNKLIDEFIQKAGLTVKGQHEYGLASGRIDSKYGGVVIEYKDPKGSNKITENKNAPGVKAVVRQLKTRFRDFEAKERVGTERILGVGCDGDTLVFVRMNRGKLDAEDPQPVTPHTVQRLLRALVSLGARGSSFTPENLTASFGSESQSAQKGVRLIYGLIRATDSPKAQTFFRQWQILFGEVCGYDIRGQNPKVRKLADHYQVPAPHPPELLFAVHTYYAIFMKMLAAEIVSSFSPLGTSALKKIVSASTSNALRDELRNLEQGGIWSHLGIRNFLEGDIFSWYLDAWDEKCADAVRGMTHSLDQFDPTTLSVDPAESRDLLKQLYQQLFPKSVRHDLGEYYTPDWLAELVLDELGYDGNPDKRLLDPACGSGTFLVMALNRVKTWYDEHRHECGFGEDELLRKILHNIIGFDLNPLAVMAARTNYLMALRDLLRHASNVELPAYLCDSIMTPSEYGELFTTGGLGKARQLKTSAGDFNIPAEVTESREYIIRYAVALESCIRDGYSPEEFLERCEAEALPTTDATLHKNLYSKLQQLDANNQNGIWARIIKNAFAPLFIGKVDYVAGNPPWVNWENLPEGYRDDMKPLWEGYNLFTLSGSAGRLGGGKKDLSMLFTYSAVDNYLNAGGRLGFVITQSVFKTQGAGDGFRRLRYDRTKPKTTWRLKPRVVHDLSAMQVFEGATNRTAIFVCEKTTRPFKYPVKYTTWAGPSRVAQDESLASVRTATIQHKIGAIPVVASKDSSPWLTAPTQALPGIRKVIGASKNYRAYAGCCTWLNGVYWINILDVLPSGELLIENLYDVGKIPVKHVQAVIEPDLVYPLLRGRDVHRWSVNPSAHIILAQDPETRRGIPEAEMKRHWSKTFAYLKQFEGNPKKPERGTLRGRSGYRQYFKPTDPFYSMYNVGPYTMAEWKVLWPEVGHSVRASVSGPSTVEKVKPSLPDHTIVAVSCGSESEAYFVAGMLNSSPAHVAVAAYIVLHPSPHIMENIAVPRFKKADNNHTRLAELSSQCHAAAKQNRKDQVAELEAEIDEVAARIWGVPNAELQAIQEALADK